MRKSPSSAFPKLMRSSFPLAMMLGLQLAQAQTAPPPASTQTPAARQEQTQPVNASTAARFIENCNDSLQRGVVDPGCQAPIYRNELERLKKEAITTQNPNLLSFVGDAYRNPRTGFGDMGQAYRWYLMAAVRGDPQAMQRLAEMNRSGLGVPKDNVKAMGYARLVQRMTQAGANAKPNVVSIINELGDQMAVEEIALAERFATQLEEQILRQGGGTDAGGSPASVPVTPTASPPGVPQPSGTPFPGTGAVTPGTALPGVPAPRAP